MLSAPVAAARPDLVSRYGSDPALAAFVRDRSRTAGKPGSAAGFQGYCERGGADGERADEVAERLDGAGSDGGEPPEEGGLDRRRRKRRLEDLARDDEGVIETSGIGESLSERRAFWDAVEAFERSGGRVRSRIIAELPHEVGVDLARGVLASFTAEFAARGLPFYAVAHESEARGGGDRRNRHAHVLYYDRPSIRRADGTWDFGAGKCSDARSREWVGALRRA